MGIAFWGVLSAKGQQFASELKMSTDENMYWYRICNASSGMQDFVMTDCSNENDAIQVQILQTEMADKKSQWKLTATDIGDKLVLTNRATGLQLGSVSLNIGDHNSTQLTQNDSQGFTITPLGENTFSLKSIEDDGVERCLALAEQGSPPLIWPEGDLSTSVIGWKFMLVDTNDSVDTNDIDITNADSEVTIRVEGKCVYVSGCSNWKLFNTQGDEILRKAKLPRGVYMVKTPYKVFKVMVR